MTSIQLRMQVELWERTCVALGYAQAANHASNGNGAAAIQDTVEYEGMLISAAAAEGRRYLPSHGLYDAWCMRNME